MKLTMLDHPISSFSWKVAMGLYEAGVPFQRKTVDLMDPAARAEFLKISPFGKIPTLRDDDTGRVYLETSVILEALAPSLLPSDRERALAVRYWDRFFDLYVNVPMGIIVEDKFRPQKDPYGLDRARANLGTAYDVLEKELAAGELTPFAGGEAVTLADCAAAPSLWYANKVQPFGEHERIARYLERLEARPSFQRVLEEAKPLMHMFPG